jgi:hypothetical protein
VFREPPKAVRAIPDSLPSNSNFRALRLATAGVAWLRFDGLFFLAGAIIGPLLFLGCHDLFARFGAQPPALRPTLSLQHAYLRKHHLESLSQNRRLSFEYFKLVHCASSKRRLCCALALDTTGYLMNQPRFGLSRPEGPGQSCHYYVTSS